MCVEIWSISSTPFVTDPSPVSLADSSNSLTEHEQKQKGSFNLTLLTLLVISPIIGGHFFVVGLSRRW